MEALCAPFLWSLVPVIWQGFRYDKLVASELPALPKKFAAENVLPRALEIWPKLSSTSCWCRCIPKSLRLLCFLWLDEFSLGMFWSCVQGVLPTVVRPLLLKNLIDHVGSDDDWDKSTAVVYVVALLATLILEGFSTTAARVYLADRCGAALVSTWSGMIYSKALRVASGASDNERTLLSNDVMKCFDQAKILCMFPQCFSAVLGGVCMLLLTIGSSAIIGLVLLFLTLCVTSYMSRLCASAEQKALSGADARLRLMTKAVEGIKAVKLSAWEPQFLAQISDARRVEVRWVTRRRFFYQCGVQIGRCAPVFCAAASIMAIVLFDGDFIPGNVFAAVSIFQSMRLAMTMIPTGLSILASWSVSAKRLDKFFELSEMAGLSSQLDKGVLLQASGAFIQQGKDYHSSFRCEVGHLNILTGRVTAIVGAVGSGKTTLLSGLLGEVAVEGWCRIASSRVGYIPQQAFVVSGSLRQNVLMGRDYSEIEYNKALFRAVLDVDIAAMPYGDATEIGERGVTLSGGQQQRLNIARAIYSCPDLLVADDPLSAVDARVGKHIADHCIFNWRLASGDLGTVIVCLNQLHLLPRCDDTIVLKDGKIVEQGCFGALSESPSSALSSMIKGLGLEAAGADKAADMDAQEQTKESAIVGKTQLTQAESIAEGAIRANVWRSYARGMGYGYCVLCFICPVGAYVCGGVSDRWLAEWLDKKITLSNSEDVTYGCIYGALVVGMAAGLIITTSVFSCSTARAGRSLHDDACSGLFHAPLSWFESTPSGRIISRFASDLSAVDYNFSTFLEHVTGFAGQSFVILAVLCILAPAVAVVLPFALFLFCLKMVAVERSSRALKRFANAAMSPVVSCFAEATHSQGRPLLRAMGLREASWQAFASAVNELVRCNMLASSVISWQTSWSYRISFLFSFVCSVWVLFGPIKTPTAQLGLALTYAFLLPYFLLYFAFCFSILKMNGTSLERLLEACLLPREADWYLGSSPITDSTQWPKKGQIAFEDVVLVYRPGLPPALSGVSLTIPGGSRVGVVGRTGAGKSSLIVPLFRLVDPYSGRVLLDGIDVQGVGLQQLRRCMSIIPQEPLLLTGTIRDNLDPFGDRSDADLVKVLADVGLDLSLDGCVNQGASGLSGGERQLVTMARALLQKAVVCVMDEPTSQVDHKTDAAVQRAVRECLVGRTLVTIAHRLQTVIDFDIIVVMDSGKVVENGSPTELLGKLEGHFARMAAVAGGREALLKQARGEDYHSKSATIVAV